MPASAAQTAAFQMRLVLVTLYAGRLQRVPLDVRLDLRDVYGFRFPFSSYS